MSGPQGIMILVSELHYRTAELRKVSVYDIGKLVACEDCLILEDAHIAPSLNDLGLYIPESRVTEKVCSVVEEACRTYHLSVAGTRNVHHLSGFRTKEHDKAVLAFLLSVLAVFTLSISPGYDRYARQDGEHTDSY